MAMIGSDTLQGEPARVEAGSMPAPSCSATASAGEGTAVIVSTRGRPDIVSALVEQLAGQTRAPRHIFVIGSSAADIARIDPNQPNVTARVGREGSSSQRNDGLALAGSRFSYVVFFDDDFVPSRFWIERMEAVFESDPSIVGLRGPSWPTAPPPPASASTRHGSWSGPTTPIRDRRTEFITTRPTAATWAATWPSARRRWTASTFDERLPLYAWWRMPISAAGRAARQDRPCRRPVGRPPRHKQGRGRGLTIGYFPDRQRGLPRSERHGSEAAPDPAGNRNMIGNLVRSVRPEPSSTGAGACRAICWLCSIWRGVAWRRSGS